MLEYIPLGFQKDFICLSRPCGSLPDLHLHIHAHRMDNAEWWAREDPQGVKGCRDPRGAQGPLGHGVHRAFPVPLVLREGQGL